MVIFIIYNQGITVLNLECNSPVPADFDRPGSFTISFERVEIQAWQIHIFKVFSCFKESESFFDPSRMLRFHTA